MAEHRIVSIDQHMMNAVDQYLTHEVVDAFISALETKVHRDIRSGGESDFADEVTIDVLRALKRYLLAL